MKELNKRCVQLDSIISSYFEQKYKVTTCENTIKEYLNRLESIANESYSGNHDLAYETDVDYQQYGDLIYAKEEELKELKITLNQFDDKIRVCLKLMREYLDFMDIVKRKYIYYQTLGIDYSKDDVQKILRRDDELISKSSKALYWMKHYLIQEAYNQIILTCEKCGDCNFELTSVFKDIANKIADKENLKKFKLSI